ncbi:MAG: hypothetical protein FJ276_17225, partial [Planctomycetes bacterium]|nr:hypothetical protein [Planctomycetota bacterium]
MFSRLLPLASKKSRRKVDSRRGKSLRQQQRHQRRQLLLESLERRVVMDATLHNVAAAMVDVVQNDTGNSTTSVTVTAPYAFNDFRIRSGSNRADYNVQIGPSATDDVVGGILLTSITNNGRDNGETTTPPGPGVVRYGTSAIDANTAGYWIPVFDTSLSGYSGGTEYNFNVAAAWFPYADGWYGGWARNSAGTNGGPNNLFTGTPGLVLDTHFKDLSGGRSTVDLTPFGINSQTNGVLLVVGGKNEDNFALSQANADGTWTIFCHDNGADSSSYEQDYVAFAYVPLTGTPLVAGKFLGNLTDAFGRSPAPYTVTNPSTGVYRLTITGQSPSTGVLIISAEGGAGLNVDNVVSYQVNGDGWDIQTRDLPNMGLQNIDATNPVISFAFIPGPTPGFTVNPTSGLLTTENGGTATFTVALDTKPAADVTIALSSSDTTEGTVAPASLTFTSADWNQPQTVTVTGQDDALVDGAVAYTIVLDPAVSTDPNYNGRNPSDVSVLNADNEVGVTVSPLSGLTTTEAGGTATFIVRLNVQPTADVVIDVSSSDLTEGTVSPASLTFTVANWNQDQTVTVTGVDDFIDDGDIAYTIVTAPAVSADVSYNGFDPSDVSVTNIDNDATGITLTPSTPLTTTEAGGTAGFSVVLTSQPAADVTVALASSDTTEGTVAPASLTFTPTTWNAPQTATVTGVDDFVGDGNIGYTIVTTVTSADAAYDAWSLADVAVTNLDNEPLVALAPGSLLYGIGMPATGLDPTATVTDPVSADYDTGTLTVALTANADADDRLGIRHIGTGAGQVGVSGGTVTFGGTPVGTFTGGAGATPLVVTFNAAATPAVAQAVLRAVTYHNVSSNPTRGPRTASVVLANGDGGASNTATRTIQLTMPRVLEFQEGADFGFGPYAGAADIELSENAPNNSYPQGSDASGLLIDWPNPGVPNAAQVLLRFDSLFGNDPGQIPLGATIVSAELFVTINNTGDGGKVHRMLIPWDANDETWNLFGNGVAPRNTLPGVQADNAEARLAYDSQLGVVDGS